MVERERSLDIHKLSKEDLANLSNFLGQKTREMVDDAADKINALLKIYGMTAKLQVVIEQLAASAPKNIGTSTKGGGASRKQS